MNLKGKLIHTRNLFLHYIKTNAFALCLMATAWLVFFSPILFNGKVYFLDDLKIIFYPLETEYATFQHAWQLPQWSLFFGFGQPLLAWGQLGFFTPLHVLLRALYVPPLILLQVSVMTYLAFGMIGMFTWLKSRLLNQHSAALGAIIFVFSGFTIGHLNHVNFYTSTMWLPWLLLSGSHLIKKPTLRQGVLLSVIVTMIAISGNPQVVVYTILLATVVLTTFFIADFITDHQVALKQPLSSLKKAVKQAKSFFWPLPKRLKIILIVIGAGLLTVTLSSFATLPLLEFLPQTERADSLPMSELFEFSYPPWHTITLVLPYFFGGHDNYWGPKGFQELAAFVGLIPLLLAGMALGTWRTHKAERVSAILLICISILMGLGSYSFFYTFLVEHHILQSFATPGRFTFYLDVGLLILAALGLHDLTTLPEVSKPGKKALPFVVALLFLAALATPFFIEISWNDRVYKHLIEIAAKGGIDLYMVLLSFFALPIMIAAYHFPKIREVSSIILTIAATGILLVYAWSYNPTTEAALARSISPFIQDLKTYNSTHPIPGRLYSHPQLVRIFQDTVTPRRTDFFSPSFTVYQPFLSDNKNLSCVNVLMNTTANPSGSIEFKLYEDPHQNPIRQIKTEASNFSSYDSYPFCFEPIIYSTAKTYWFSLSSTTISNTFAFARPAADQTEEAYYIRKTNTSTSTWESSRKKVRLVSDPSYGASWDKESSILARHLQVVAGVSSARWIGALSIKPYRDFIEEFFANDVDQPIDGDGLHTIERHRSILNVAGITHLMQELPNGVEDGMLAQGYTIVNKFLTGNYEARLYFNPQAFPKAFLIDQATAIAAADETRYVMQQSDFDPTKTIIITGPTPPSSLPAQAGTAAKGSATIAVYSPTQVDVQVQTPDDVYLVVSDSTTDQWQTYIDNKRAPQYVANSLFKAAIVPAGSHTVSFRYESPAVKNAKLITSVGIIIALLASFPWHKLPIFLKERKEEIS